jgi:hypothetical protein
MSGSTLLDPREYRVNRSTLREEQSAILRKACGLNVVLVENRGEGDEKCILDKEYFDNLIRELRIALETLQITMDAPLFKRLMKSAATLEEETTLGKLHSLDDVFDEE